jgi:hypothetical protein
MQISMNARQPDVSATLTPSVLTSPVRALVGVDKDLLVTASTAEVKVL